MSSQEKNDTFLGWPYNIALIWGIGWLIAFPFLAHDFIMWLKPLMPCCR